ncbi:MAG: cupin domain-containing protein [Candidatus Competibacter sp.]
MNESRIENAPDGEKLRKLAVESWPIWIPEISEFPWEYDAEETCYLLEGRVTVTPEVGAPVEIGPGDLVIFPQGMRCVWRVDAPRRKHYSFS